MQRARDMPVVRRITHLLLVPSVCELSRWKDRMIKDHHYMSRPVSAPPNKQGQVRLHSDTGTGCPVWPRRHGTTRPSGISQAGAVIIQGTEDVDGSWRPRSETGKAGVATMSVHPGLGTPQEHAVREGAGHDRVQMVRWLALHGARRRRSGAARTGHEPTPAASAAEVDLNGE